MDRKRERKRLWWAVLGSIFVHLLVAFSLAAFNQISGPAVPLEEKPLELTMMDLSAAPTPSVPINPPFIENDPEKESAEEPKEKTFESNANSLARSNAPASGDAPLPSQEGKERPFLNMQTQASSLAARGATPQPTPPPVATPLPTATPAIPPPTATPATPLPTQTPRPSEPPTPTPLPEPIATPQPDQLAMLTSTPPPAIRDPDEVDATPPPEVQPTVPPPNVRPLPERPATAYQPEKEQTRISGNITNRGPSSVNAVATPLGKYKKLIGDAIGSRWHYYIGIKGDLANIGTAYIEAEVDAQGKIQNLRLRSNSSNEAFANICLQSFQEAQIPPIPPDLVATLPGGRVPLEFSFTYFAN